MGQLSKQLRSSVWLLLWAGLAVNAADAQIDRYPPHDEAWDGTSYRAVIQRVETEGLPLPALSDPATKPVFERMVNVDNIPLRMGLNRELAVAIRFQRLDSALPAVHKLVVLYANEMKKGKPYAQELAKLMVYETKISAAMLDLSEQYLTTRLKDKRYQVHVQYIEQVKTDARQSYSGLVEGMAETRLYSRADILQLIEVALDGLPSYLPILTDQDRQALVQRLTQQVSTTTDQELKTTLTQLRDAIQNRRIRA
jgi:hypothetical protein